jgi:diguanylate cyclase (GGDEF)-like protein/PAS domain S-box-containing protein
LFLTYVPLLLLVFRYRFAGVVFGTSVVAGIAMAGTFAGSGPLLLTVGATLTEQTLLLQLFIASTCLVTMPVALAMTERAMLLRRVRDSEARYRMLAEYSLDIVVRIRADGQRLYISPAVTELLGWHVAELREPRWDLLHPDDVEPVKEALRALYAQGGASVITYRMLHKAGHYVWIEAHARLVPSADGAEKPDVVYSGRDVTARIEAQAALSESRRMLQAIADNVPAIIAYFNRNGVYEFANAATGEMLGVDPQTLIGRTLREAAGEETYGVIQQYVVAALCGERVTYERLANVRGVERHYEVTFMPDVIADGSVRGFFALSYDVSERKRIELLLDRLAREDALTGLPNRREFESRVQRAIETRRHMPRGMVLMLMDVDHFKSINDTHGHQVGDAVLAAVANRLKSCVHDEDLVARLGGDEFAILIERTATAANANRIAERIVAAMKRVIPCDGKLLNATLSVGVAYAEEPASLDSMAKLADRALYAAKAAGRNTYRSASEAPPPRERASALRH